MSTRRPTGSTRHRTAAFAAVQPVPEAAGPVDFEARIIPDQAERRRRMQDVMSECGMVVRSGEALARGIECLDQLTEGCVVRLEGSTARAAFEQNLAEERSEKQ